MKIYKQWLADDENKTIRMTLQEWVKVLYIYPKYGHAELIAKCGAWPNKRVELQINDRLIPCYEWHKYFDIVCYVRNADLDVMKIAGEKYLH